MTRQPRDRLREVLENLRSVLAAEVAAGEDRVSAKATVQTPRIEVRKALAMRLGLHERLSSTAVDVRYYPFWTNTSPQDVCPMLQDARVESRKDGGRDVASMTFTWRDVEYRMEFEPHLFPMEDDEPTRFGTLTLHDPTGKKLFEVGMSQPSYGGPWRSWSVEAFAPGEWVIPLLELSEQFEVFKRQLALQRREDELRDTELRFGLDDAGDAAARTLAGGDGERTASAGLKNLWGWLRIGPRA